MRIAIMQPYFFPYLGYFSGIAASDRWIAFDTPQYIRRGWVNRNRVLSLGKDEWKYIQVPTAKADRNTPINQMRLSPNVNWRTDLIRNLDYYKINRAPHYDDVLQLLDSVWMCDTLDLSKMLIHCLCGICRYLEKGSLCPDAFISEERLEPAVLVS